jgi:LmbE family N-acetylglucosaminyl deacetylase
MRRLTLRWSLLLLPLSLIMFNGIPGIPNPFIHVLFWRVPVPVRTEFPEIDWENERVLIIAPHPDDEVLAVGGTIADLALEGHSILVVFLTNGDANRAAKRLLTLSPLHRATDYRSLGYRRQKEATAALASLGLPPDRIIFLGYPDQGLMSLWSDYWDRDNPYRSPYTKACYPFYTNSYNPDAVYAGEDLLSDLANIIDLFRPTVLYVPHQDDLHPDHKAGFLFGMAAESVIQEMDKPDIRLYLVHAAGWPYPTEVLPAMVLDAPDEASDWSWQSYCLSEEAVEKKLRAVYAYSSQYWTNAAFLTGFIQLNELYVSPNLDYFLDYSR